METRKRSRDYDMMQPLSKRCREQTQQPPQQGSFKRSRESEEFTMNKRIAMSSEYSEFRNEIMQLQISMNEMRQQQRMCYQIMAGQSAQIRKLEQQLQSVQYPVGEPWLQPLVHAN